MSPSEKPCLFLIDDNPRFIEMLDRDIDRYFRPQLVWSGEYPSLDALLEEVRKHRPNHLVVDVDLGQPGLSEQIIKTLAEQGDYEGDIWLISHQRPPKDKKEELVAQYQKLNADVRNLIAKPINARKLYLRLTCDEEWDLPEPLAQLPLPVRALSEQGAILATNDQWADVEYPQPPEDRGTESQPTYFPGPLSDNDTDTAGFLLHTRCFEAEDGATRWLQLAERQRLPETDLSVKKLIERIFAALRDRGFPRGRFYRVRRLMTHAKGDQETRSLELKQLSKAHPWQDENGSRPSHETPYRLEPGTALQQRLQAYQGTFENQRNHNQKELIWEILGGEADDQDNALKALHERIDKDTAKYICNWLEIPVWLPASVTPEAHAPSSEAQGNTTHCELTGLLVFDRGPTGSDKNRPVIDPEIEKEEITPLEPLLQSLVAQLREQLRQERYQDLWQEEQRMRQWDRKLLEAESTEKRLQQLIEALREIAEADSAILTLEEAGGLRIQAVTFGDTASESEKNLLKSTLPGKTLSKDAEVHPIVAAWKAQSPRVWQDYAASPAAKALCKHLEAPTDCLGCQDLGDASRTAFQDWIGQIGTLIALPVTVPETGNSRRRIGGITLQYRDRYRATRCLWERLRAILHRARWVLQQHWQQQQEQVFWDRGLNHEMKSLIAKALQHVARARTHSDSLDCLDLYLQQARDLAERLGSRSGTGPAVSNRTGRFCPAEPLQGYIALLERCPAAEPADWQIEPGFDDTVWQVVLAGDESVFGRIVRELLNNALHHGAIALGLTEAPPVPIRLQATLTTREWQLQLTNPGPINPPEEIRGTQTGLKLVRHWCQQQDAHIDDPKETDDGQVQVLLHWPLPNTSGTPS